MRRRFTDEVANVAPFAGDTEAAASGDALLAFETTGPWADLLEQLDVSLAVSREYEHLLLLLGADGGRPWQSALALPHPSGLFWDGARGELIASSTRTPNQLFFFRALGATDFAREVVPADLVPPAGTLFVPYRSVLLPGTLYIHDVVPFADGLHVTATGHNFIARVGDAGGWTRVWWPACVDGLGRASFDQNYLQLNSIAGAATPGASFYTAFSDRTSGPKPWKEGYGPRGKGVVFSGATRGVVTRGLTCPHSAKLRDGVLWLCNSGYGEVGVVDLGETRGEERPFSAVAGAPGFTRGLAFAGDYAFVGLSRVIDFYEPYAPGLDPKASRCGIVVVDVRTGATVASLVWPEGYQIYDVQAMPGVRRPLLPSKPAGETGINVWLRYLG
jgi:uncharacterized protein (TIGR03032 family)